MATMTHSLNASPERDHVGNTRSHVVSSSDHRRIQSLVPKQDRSRGVESFAMHDLSIDSLDSKPSPRNLRTFNASGVSAQDMINAQVGHSEFGIQEYSPPKCMFPKLRVPGGKFDKQKNVSFTETVAKNKSLVPAPDKYVSVNDWKRAVPGNKGRFLRS